MGFPGPNLSLFCFLISGWGTVQLAFMSLLFYTKALALVDDVPQKSHYRHAREFISDLDLGMSQNATNCGIAACLYLVTTLLSGSRYFMLQRGGTQQL